MAPSIRIGRTATLVCASMPGAMFTAIGWVLASQLFALYVRFAGNANQVQSGVGVILLLAWFVIGRGVL